MRRTSRPERPVPPVDDVPRLGRALLLGVLPLGLAHRADPEGTHRRRAVGVLASVDIGLRRAFGKRAAHGNLLASPGPHRTTVPEEPAHEVEACRDTCVGRWPWGRRSRREVGGGRAGLGELVLADRTSRAADPRASRRAPWSWVCWLTSWCTGTGSTRPSSASGPRHPSGDVDPQHRSRWTSLVLLVLRDQDGQPVAGLRGVEDRAGAVGAHPPQRRPVVGVVVDEEAEAVAARARCPGGGAPWSTSASRRRRSRPSRRPARRRRARGVVMPSEFVVASRATRAAPNAGRRVVQTRAHRLVRSR